MTWIQSTKEYDQAFRSLAISPKGDDIALGMMKPQVEQIMTLSEIAQNIKNLITAKGADSSELEA